MQMFKNISEIITNRLLKAEVIEYDDAEIYQFGLEQLLAIVLNIATTIILGIIFNELWNSMVFVLSFMLLRTYAGGYHANTPSGCYLLTTAIIAAVLSVVKYVEINIIICAGLLLVSSASILILSPVESANKPIDSIEHIIYRKKTVAVWCIETIFAVISAALGLNRIAICIMASYVILGISLIAGVIQSKIK